MISTSVNLMLSVLVINTCGDKLRLRLYYDASCGVFHPCHYPYTFLTIVVSIVFIVLPSLFIFLHPRKIFNRCRDFQCQLLQVANEVESVSTELQGWDRKYTRLPMVCRDLPSDKGSYCRICDLEDITANTSNKRFCWAYAGGYFSTSHSDSL